MRGNVSKSARHASLLLDRLLSWGSTDERLVELSAGSHAVLDKLASMDEILVALEDEEFVPPLKPRAVVFATGQGVRIAEKYRAKYREIYADVLLADSQYLDDLVVLKVLESGEVVVRRGRSTPFAVSKTHLVHARSGDGDR